ncbi:MAG TPA: glycosyltransferase family 4 protein [Terriglobales bacterium]|nr:glycosyltransferase family 4 protein [Terriglobales bacterium]
MSKILFLVAHPVEDASRRYRIEQFLPLLERAGYECTVSEFSTPQLFEALHSKGKLAAKAFHSIYCSARRVVRLAALSKFDLIFIHREAFPFFTPAFENWVVSRHGKVVFSFDDAIYAAHPDASLLNHPWLYRFKYGRSLEQVIARSFHVVAGNRTLEKYAERFNSKVTVIPTVVDCEKYQYKPVGDGTRPLVVGWMGSRSTASYLSSIAPVLRKLAATLPGRVEFRLFGCQDMQLDIPHATYCPFRLQSELPDLRTLDIGLMPMPDSRWTRGKCAFKAIQYMAMGIPTVASPVGATQDLIQHNDNGLLADSSDQWFEHLQQLVSGADLRRRISLRARQTIEDNYSLQVWGPRMVALIDEMCGTSVAPAYRVPKVDQQVGSPALHR